MWYSLRMRCKGMNQFWDLLERSIITQSIITAALIGVTCYLYVAGHPVPEGLQTLTYTVVAFWMGSKVQHSVDQAYAKKG